MGSPQSHAGAEVIRVPPGVVIAGSPGTSVVVMGSSWGADFDAILIALCASEREMVSA